MRGCAHASHERVCMLEYKQQGYCIQDKFKYSSIFKSFLKNCRFTGTRYLDIPV